MSLDESAGIDHQYDMQMANDEGDSSDQKSNVNKHLNNDSEDKYSKVNSTTLACDNMNKQQHWMEGVNLKSKQLSISNGGNTLINRDNVLLPTQHRGLTSLDKQKINDACKDVSSPKAQIKLLLKLTDLELLTTYRSK